MTAAMKKVIIHVGQYKTGTTSIQKFMWESRDSLLSHGILYPEALTRDCAHFLITDLLRKEYRNTDDWADLAPLREEIDESEARTTVISCESLSGATVRRFAPGMMKYMWGRLIKLFEGFDVRAVFYVRRQDESIDSRIIQEIKGQSRKSNINHEPFLYSKSSLNYNYFFELLEQVFGKGQVDARLYDRKHLCKSDVRYDFLDYLDLPTESLTVPDSEDNVSPSAKFVGFYRVLNSMKLSGDDYASLSAGLWRWLCASGGEKAVVLGAKERDSVMNYFMESNKKFIDEYIHDNDKKKFSTTLLGAVKNVESNVFVDGIDVLRILKSKGFDVVRSA